MHPTLRAAYRHEASAARAALQAGSLDAAEYHAGRAHILGSHFFASHVTTHLLLGRIAWRRRKLADTAVQGVRVIGAFGTRLLAPFFGTTGNPGSSDRSVAGRYPLPNDLRELLQLQEFTHWRAPNWIVRGLQRLWAAETAANHARRPSDT